MTVTIDGRTHVSRSKSEHIGHVRHVMCAMRIQFVNQTSMPLHSKPRPLPADRQLSKSDEQRQRSLLETITLTQDEPVLGQTLQTQLKLYLCYAVALSNRSNFKRKGPFLKTYLLIILPFSHFRREESPRRLFFITDFHMTLLVIYRQVLRW